MPEFGWEYKNQIATMENRWAVLQVVENQLTICCGFNIVFSENSLWNFILTVLNLIVLSGKGFQVTGSWGANHRH